MTSLDFQVKSCTRRCAVTGRSLAAGEAYYSVLQFAGAEAVRRDYSSEAWEGPPEEAVAWWQARMAEPGASKPKLAPNEALLKLVDELSERDDQLEFRYVLALLLVRRRVLRMEGHGADEKGRETLVVCNPSCGDVLEIVVAEPDEAGAEQLDRRITELFSAEK